ncbi:hypothetical protein BT63DRAFT_430447 [Microthyrium microscopicum]|uniref:DUF8035 domain-containing protein n=1 Tax=Microthyrium microscopicum TaxID=703497 RepID=A0A6A6TT60_9PEZI|nr:hypothetical protein BT63DRAFT_430447 [Microthyrium microscopicum]
MSGRRYPVADLYEERRSDVYRNGRGSVRDYEELDIDLRHGRQQNLDFLDEDYGRSGRTAGALVVRERPREVEEDVIRIRERSTGPPSRRARSVERDEIVVRRGERDRFRRDAEKEEIDVTIRKEERPEPAPPRRRPREVERDEIIIRHEDSRSRQPKPKPRPREVVEHEDDIIIRGRDHGERETIEVRHRETSRPPAPTPRSTRSVVDFEEDIDIRGRGFGERENIQIRHSHSRPPVRHETMPPPTRGGTYPLGRESEEIVVRRRKPRSLTPSPSPPPPPRREVHEDEVIIRRRRPRTPSPPPPPPPPVVEEDEIIIRRTKERSPSPLPPPREPTPPPAPIIRPPIHQEIHQEIITHHRHIDHGVERAWSPEPLPPPKSPSPPPPPPPPPPPAMKEEIEIDIKRRGRRGDFEEDIHVSTNENAMVRHRSLSAPRRRYDDDLEEEAEYYNRKQMERAYVGEAKNGATQDWNIVDVPPGTERIRMDGVGGSSQEVTWQRYNGVRRAKFISGDREFDSGFGMPERQRSPSPAPAPAPLPPPAASPPPTRRPTDMWTEITKDLVLKDAIDAFGYQYEETEFFFYVMEYLKYEDVLQLVELSDDIRRERRRRIREIEWERENLRRPRYNDRYYEREIIVDTRDGRRRR